MCTIIIDKSNSLYDKKVQSSDSCITVFTPTYNRCRLLLRVYECLRNQDNRNFVWIVISDGSTDATDETMTKLVDETDIPIRYVSKENGGKHTALKLGMELTETDYFCDCDDDDTFVPDMISFFLLTWKQIESEGRNDIGAVRSLTQYEDGRIVCGYQFDKNDMSKQFDATTLEMEYIRNQHQENQTCYSIKALRSTDIWPSNYWLSERHTFLTEGIWQGRLARKYKCRYVNKVTRTYNDSSEGLMRGKISHQRALNFFVNYHMILNEQYDYIVYNKVRYLKYVLITGMYRSFIGISVFQHCKHLEKSGLRGWMLTTAPLCYILCKLKLRG